MSGTEDTRQKEAAHFWVQLRKTRQTLRRGQGGGWMAVKFGLSHCDAVVALPNNETSLTFFLFLFFNLFSQL